MIHLRLTDAQGRLLQQSLEEWQHPLAKELLSTVYGQIRQDFNDDDEDEGQMNSEFFGENTESLTDDEREAIDNADQADFE